MACQSRSEFFIYFGPVSSIWLSQWHWTRKQLFSLEQLRLALYKMTSIGWKEEALQASHNLPFAALISLVGRAKKHYSTIWKVCWETSPQELQQQTFEDCSSNAMQWRSMICKAGWKEVTPQKSKYYHWQRKYSASTIEAEVSWCDAQHNA